MRDVARREDSDAIKTKSQETEVPKSRSGMTKSARSQMAASRLLPKQRRYLSSVAAMTQVMNGLPNALETTAKTRILSTKYLTVLMQHRLDGHKGLGSLQQGNRMAMIRRR